ncbi:hypothetical protein THOM_1113 [Trachipleistophora hominis]|uniref:Uncharacterized protein n=1 Tax=Trachipleistophora hominis TaxID=72359 RepID=L7JXZ0_TRAHO|nr:hypothetical protein THOM_1113 [Trachipleistophora hominis]
MNILLSIISFITALELRSLVYDNKLYIYPAKRRGTKTLSDFMFERNVGLGVRLKKFVLRSEDHLTVNDFWRILGKNNEELTRKNHILRLVDDKLRISPFVTPVDGVTIFSILLDLLKLPENCYIFLVVDDTEIKEIAKDAIQAFSNVNLLLRFILPKSLVLALDGFLKGRIQKKYLLVINTSGKKSVFSFYTTCKGHKKENKKVSLIRTRKLKIKKRKTNQRKTKEKILTMDTPSN